MKRVLIRRLAALAACFSVCAGTSCGKVERQDNGENISVSGSETSTSGTDTEVLTIPVAADENTSQTATNAEGEELPVSGQPSEGTSSYTASGTGSHSQTTSGAVSPSQVSEISLTFYEVTLPVGGSKMPIVTMSPDTAENKKEIWTSSDTSVASVDSLGNIMGVGEGKCIITVKSDDNPAVSANVEVTVEAAPESAVADGVTYIDGILIANKTYALPASYNPGGLTNECYSAFMNLVSGAAADNINIYCSSGFRSYESQQYIYNNYVAADGQAKADTYSARPGHSEHQTGLAIDCNIIDDSFTGTPEAIWLENNCYKYGFIIRYPRNKDHITGYKYEPWHIRYLGVEKATAVYNSGLCLEEYLGITSQYTY